MCFETSPAHHKDRISGKIRSIDLLYIAVAKSAVYRDYGGNCVLASLALGLKHSGWIHPYKIRGSSQTTIMCIINGRSNYLIDFL